MEITNIAEKQMNLTDQDFSFDPFFTQYFRLFNSNENFWQDTLQLMEQYTINDVSETVSFLELIAKEMLIEINKNMKGKIDVGMITFFGDCSFDGHGILIDGKPHVFFDLNAIIPRLDFYNFRAFITHELLHPIHYDLNRDFYHMNHKTVEEQYFKLLFSEGIATYLSFIISKESIEDTYWFGFIDQEQVSEWINNCENMKHDIGNDLYKAARTNVLDPSLYNRLFGIENFDQITSYRTGYYYGAEIVKKLFKEKSIHDVLTIPYDEAKKIIYNYFS